MNAILAVLDPYKWLAAAILAVLVCLGVWWFKSDYDNGLREEGREEMRAHYADAALAEAASKGREGLRRIEKQQENQRAQDRELAVARAAAVRNADDADRVRSDAATAAREWATRLADSPTAADLATAAETIAVLTNVRGRLDSAASELASYASASATAGSKCERDYDALTVK